MSTARWCCVIECKENAEFYIVNENDPYDDTDACSAHVGELLGSNNLQPPDLKKVGIFWVVSPIPMDPAVWLASLG